MQKGAAGAAFFADAVVDAVTTLPPGDPAVVRVGYDGSYVHFTFGIPQCSEDAPGEVSAAQLAAEVTGTEYRDLHMKWVHEDGSRFMLRDLQEEQDEHDFSDLLILPILLILSYPAP